MVTYILVCFECGHAFEKRAHMGDTTATCPKCGGVANSVITAPALSPERDTEAKGRSC